MDHWEALDAVETETDIQVMLEQRPASFEAFRRSPQDLNAIDAFPSRHGPAVYFRDVTEHKQARTRGAPRQRGASAPRP